MTADVVRETLIGGRYELETQLGRGGMGEVWRARHVTLKQHVAIKFLARASAAREVARKRFESEAQITAQLKTRHAVQVFDYGITEGGQPYLVMELLDGETVGHRLDRLKALTVATTATFLGQAARALERAHSVGIVHRDFKPDNLVIAVDEDGREYIKVLDFGIAKILGDLEIDAADDDDPDPTLRGGDPSSFTRTGSILGTPYYMAPEQIRNSRDIDPRVDIWAFGVVAFECLTGAPPFDGQDLFELFDNIQAGRHPRARELNPALPPAFDMWFDIACAGDKEKRFASARIAASHLGVALGDAALTDVTAAGRKSGMPADRPGPADLAHAATMASTHAGKVLSRKRRSVGASGTAHSLVNIPSAARRDANDPGGLVPAGTSEPARRNASVRPPPTQPAHGKRARWIAIALGGLAGAVTVYALWPAPPVLKGGSAPASVPVAALPAASAAMVETMATAAATATAPAPAAGPAPAAASDSASAQEPAAVRPTRTTSSSKPTPVAAPTPSAVTVAPTAPSAAPAPPAPTKSAKSAFDLPPLGI